MQLVGVGSIPTLVADGPGCSRLRTRGRSRRLRCEWKIGDHRSQHADHTCHPARSTPIMPCGPNPYATTYRSAGVLSFRGPGRSADLDLHQNRPAHRSIRSPRAPRGSAGERAQSTARRRAGRSGGDFNGRRSPPRGTAGGTCSHRFCGRPTARDSGASGRHSPAARPCHRARGATNPARWLADRFCSGGEIPSG